MRSEVLPEQLNLYSFFSNSGGRCYQHTLANVVFPFPPLNALAKEASCLLYTSAQKPLEKEQTSSPDERSYYKRHDRHLQQTLRQHEGLERNRKRSHRRNQDRHQGMLFYPGMNPPARLALSLTVIGLAAFAH